MQVKAPLPLRTVERADLSPVVEACLEWIHLKQLYRQGWLRRGIPRAQCESVAEHTYAVAVLALLLVDAEPQLDRDKVLRMALLHDFGEIYAGDLTPGDAVPQEEKQRREMQSVQQVLGKLPQGKAYLALWEEYEAGITSEAQFVRQVDRLEMALQATVYERLGWGDLSEFYTSAEEALSLPVLCAMLHELETIRPT